MGTGKIISLLRQRCNALGDHACLPGLPQAETGLVLGVTGEEALDKEIGAEAGRLEVGVLAVEVHGEDVPEVKDKDSPSGAGWGS